MTPIDDDELRVMLEARGGRHAIDPRDLVEVARRDAASSPRTGGARWRLKPIVAGIGSLTFIVLAVVLVAAPLSLRPTASARPSAPASPQVGPSSTAATPAPTLDAASERYPGGIPRVIDGEPVLLGLDAQARWRDAIDDTAFLVGGWFDSHFLHTCSGGIGPVDPNPLAGRLCQLRDIRGIPGRALFASGVDLPEGDGPIVVRVHTRDPGAATCIPEYRTVCDERTVVDAVTWFGDATTAAAPIGPQEALRNATSVFAMEWRDTADGSQTAVNEDVFTVPIACPAPWPALLFSIHGDPRYGLVAVFPDGETRERFQGETDPGAGSACLGIAIERPAAPRWVAHENVLVLMFGDDVFAARLAEVLADPQREQRALDLAEPELDRSLETLNGYLVARAAGDLDHALGERLIPDFRESDGPEDVVVDAYAEWTADVFRRNAADALVGRIEALDEEATEARVGPRAWQAIQGAGAIRSRIFRVTYPDTTDPALASEEFVVIQAPSTLFRDWQLIRISGEPYPSITPMPTPPTDPPASPDNDTTGDVPCLPAGEECGP